jgi:hypothetical protein
MNYSRPWLSGLTTFLVLIFVYALTLAPTFLHIDCGELAAAQYTLGITHPTGYPLFTILGYLFLKIPLFERPIVQANLLAALWTAAGTGIFASWLFLVLKTGFSKPDPKKKTTPLPPATDKEAFWISVSAALLFGFTLTVWAQATSVEVYSLHILLLAGVLFTSFKAWQENTISSWTICSAVLALSFSNHLTTMLILPSLAFLYIHRNGVQKESWVKLAMPAAVGFGILLLTYGFLFFRAGGDPIINWGNIHDWTTFKRHLTGHQYQTWILAGSKVAARNLGEFLKAFPKEWAFAGPVLMIFGIAFAFRSAKTLAWAITIGLLFNIFYSIQYDIKDLEPYFLLAMMGMAFFAAFGMKRIISRFQKPWALPAMLAFPLLALGLNFKASDQSKTRFFEEYTQSALESIEPDAFVMTHQWDFLIPPYYYLRAVEGKYPRLMVLDKELMRRSWYINMQAPLYEKDVFKGAEPEVDLFLKNLKPFEEDKPFDGNLIEESFQNLLGKILIEQQKKRPVYLGIECVQNQGVRIPAGYKLVPVGFWLKFVPASEGYVAAKIPAFSPFIPANWKGKGEAGYYSDFIISIWKGGCNNRAQYEADNGKPTEAQKWAAEANRLLSI